MNSDPKELPFNPVPWVVWCLVLPIAGAELAFQLQAAGLAGVGAPVAWRQAVYQQVALLPDLLRLQWETGGHPMDQLYRLVSYPLVHAEFSDALFAAILTLALGKKVAESFPVLAVLAVALVSTFAGGVAFGFLAPDEKARLIGAYPMVYGLIGAFTYLAWTDPDSSRRNRIWAFRLIGFLLAMQLVFGVLFGTNWYWIAELGGFFAGFGLSFLVAPGGFTRIGNWIRQR